MPRSVELFAGGGGMALGMLKAGFEHEQLVERDPRACSILRQNAASSPALWSGENIREMDVLHWLKDAQNAGLEDIDLIAGGPPCQPFSISGAHAGENDERNMFPAAVETVRVLRPKCFVFENVPGLLRSSFEPYYQYVIDQLAKPSVRPRKSDEDWPKHQARIRKTKRPSLSYHVHRQVIEAADVGVPQTRKRVFLIGTRADISSADDWVDVPMTHSKDTLLRDQWVTGTYWDTRNLSKPPTPENVKARVELLRREDALFETSLPWRTTRDALVGMPEPLDATDAVGFLNHRGIPGARTYTRHQGGWIDWPAKTLKAGVHGVAGGEAMIRFSDNSVRYLTVRESARIQTFPDNYELPGSRTAMMRALGNAVAVEVAALIGQQLRKTLDL
ncbi:DNA cytosine methyltransferase [Streptomyces erythrochromogenes]|uniref:DNA cytosine methyltransferase n=1 Tax=Streptomyces erythrochromogenes TaxID=285574 RepID=UPI00362C658E